MPPVVTQLTTTEMKEFIRGIEDLANRYGFSMQQMRVWLHSQQVDFQFIKDK